MVLTLTGAPVGHVTVVMVNAGSTATTDHGEFSIPLPSAFQPGFPLTVSVDGWVVESPWEGHGFVPASAAFPLEVRVVRPGDKVILSHNNVTRIIKGQVTQFRGSAVFNESIAPTLESDKEQQAYLRKQSQVLGFPVAKLKAACDDWVKRPESPFEEALAALYQNQNEKAGAILDQIARSPGPDFYQPSRTKQGSVSFRDRLIALSSADYRLGRYAQAAETLEKALAENPYDVNILSNLATVREAQGHYAQALDLLQRAGRIASVSGDKATAERIRAVSVRLTKRMGDCGKDTDCRS